jgi:hypothetical protein
MTVYVVAGTRRTLHKAVQTDAGLMTLEADNIDQTKTTEEVYTDFVSAFNAAKRTCLRCFPPGPAA